MIAYFKKKIWLILLCGFLCACALVAEKNYATSFVVRSGDYIYGCQLQIANYVDKSNPINLERYVRDEINRKVFLDKSVLLFDYSKFDAGWDKKTFMEQCQWMNSHIVINNFGEGKYNMLFVFRNNDIKDYSYLEESGEAFINEYISYLNGISDAQVIPISPIIKIMPIDKPISKKAVLIKYACAGFIVGIFSCIMFLLVTYKRGQNDL